MRKQQDLMRHIKRKTVDSFKLNFENPVNKEEIDAAVGKKYKYSELKDFDVFIIYEEQTVRCFTYNDQGNACAVPIADPVLLYFNMAQNLLRAVQDQKKNFLTLFRTEDSATISENAMSAFYQYFGSASSLIIMAMTSVEAFINRLLPETIEIPGQKCTEVYTKEQAQRWLRFDQKLTIIRKTTGKDFTKNVSYAHFNNVKDFRDQIVHTKVGERGYELYSDLYKKALNFKYNEGLFAIRDFINLYTPELVEDCPCGKDF